MSIRTKRQNLLRQLRASDLFNTTTGYPIKREFVWENELFRKARLFKRLNRVIQGCRKCRSSGLNQPSSTSSAPGYGNVNSAVMFIAQSLCTQCMSTNIPYTEGSCYLLDLSLRLVGLLRKDVFLTNVVHCHPPKNRASSRSEIRHCLPYLQEEIDIVEPKIIVPLGRDAAQVMPKLKLGNIKVFLVKHTAYYYHGGSKGTEDWIVNLCLELEKYV